MNTFKIFKKGQREVIMLSGAFYLNIENESGNYIVYGGRKYYRTKSSLLEKYGFKFEKNRKSPPGKTASHEAVYDGINYLNLHRIISDRFYKIAG